MWAGLTVMVLWFFSSSPVCIGGWELSLMLWTGKEWGRRERITCWQTHWSNCHKPVHLPTHQGHLCQPVLFTTGPEGKEITGSGISSGSSSAKCTPQILVQLLPSSTGVTLWEVLIVHLSIPKRVWGEGRLSTVPLTSQGCSFIQQTFSGAYYMPSTVFKFKRNTIGKSQIVLSQSLAFSDGESQVNI